MIEPYRQYQITLETVGPVFIGSGNKLSKNHTYSQIKPY